MDNYNSEGGAVIPSSGPTVHVGTISKAYLPPTSAEYKHFLHLVQNELKVQQEFLKTREELLKQWENNEKNEDSCDKYECEQLKGLHKLLPVGSVSQWSSVEAPRKETSIRSPTTKPTISSSSSSSSSSSQKYTGIPSYTDSDWFILSNGPSSLADELGGNIPIPSNAHSGSRRQNNNELSPEEQQLRARLRMRNLFQQAPMLSVLFRERNIAVCHSGYLFLLYYYCFYNLLFFSSLSFSHYCSLFCFS